MIWFHEYETVKRIYNVNIIEVSAKLSLLQKAYLNDEEI